MKRYYCFHRIIVCIVDVCLFCCKDSTGTPNHWSVVNTTTSENWTCQSRTDKEREKEREWRTKRQEEWSHSSIGESAFLPYYSQPWQTDRRARDGADTHTSTENTQKNLISGVWRDHFPYREGENRNVRIYIKQIETGADSVQYRFICSTGYSGNYVALQSPRIWPWPMSSAPAKQE